MANGNFTRSRKGLTARQCATLPPGKYNDGDGLWLAVSKSGSRKWFLRVTIDGRRREMDLGAIKDVPLAEARKKAKRVQGRIENVLDFAAARTWRDPVNPARWRGHLDKLLPRPTRVKRLRHQPAIDYREVPSFIAELRALRSVSSLALQFLILTACRTSEVLKAQWSEVDWETATWTIPPARMKA